MHAPTGLHHDSCASTRRQVTEGRGLSCRKGANARLIDDVGSHALLVRVKDYFCTNLDKTPRSKQVRRRGARRESGLTEA